MDENFINYIVTNDKFYQRLRKRHLKVDTETAKNTAKKSRVPVEEIFRPPEGGYYVFPVDQFGSPTKMDGPPQSPDRASSNPTDNPGSPTTHSSGCNYKTIFYHKTKIEKVLNKEIEFEELVQNDIFKLQNSI